jgi:hypothetical protein
MVDGFGAMPKKRTGPPKRRNTLTLDDDNAIRLERLRAQRDVSFKEIVNGVLRKGLAEEERPFKHEARSFELPIIRDAEPLFDTSRSINEILADMDEEDDFAKLFGETKKP